MANTATSKKKKLKASEYIKKWCDKHDFRSELFLEEFALFGSIYKMSKKCNETLSALEVI
jgi:hypothetical protein